MRLHYHSYSDIFSEDEDEDDQVRLNQLREFLEFYRLDQYYTVFVQEGFDRLLSLFDITEFDLISLNVKRGHRRLLQRAIATARGIPVSAPIVIAHGFFPPETVNGSQIASLISNQNSGSINSNIATIITSTATATASSDPQATMIAIHQPQHYIIKAPSSHRTNSSGSPSMESHHSSYHPYQHKRRKRKPHYVPAKPITAFDEFVRRLRIELTSNCEKAASSSETLAEFTNVAYDRWQQLTSKEKEVYEREALLANANLNGAHSSRTNNRSREEEEDEIDWYNIEYYQQRYHRNRSKTSSNSSASSSISSSPDNSTTFTQMELDGQFDGQV